VRKDYFKEFIDFALREDVGTGDHTSLACIPSGKVARARLKIKENGVISGVEVAKNIFNYINPSIVFEEALNDGDDVQVGQIAFSVQGDLRSILIAERLVLNLMQRMSGISTVTNQYVNCISHTKAKVLDTRKTTPGIRWFEKEAVKIGGGENHRFGLFDMVLIKDNHVDGAGGIEAALNAARAYLNEKKLNIPIEIEVRSMDELKLAIENGKADRIMLDNFSTSQTKAAVDFVNGRSLLESSGGITLETIKGYAEAGVDFISVGALTHSVKSLDMSLKIVSK
jgi:nicotinate-nucleotide pyrophosphorylase (carboxylating)